MMDGYYGAGRTRTHINSSIKDVVHFYLSLTVLSQIENI